jgi:bile acid:Na+ symporter, BASS family
LPYQPARLLWRLAGTAAMDAIKLIVPILLSLSLAGLVVSVGLQASHRDLLYVVRRPRLLVKAVVAVDLIPPAAAILLALALPIDPMVKAGIVLMAISPVPPLVPSQELNVGGRREYAFGVYGILALLTVVTVPAALAVATWAFGRHDGVALSTIAKVVLTGVLLPLALGSAVRRMAPALAARLAPWVYRLSMVLVVAAFLPIIASLWPAMIELVGNGTLLVMSAVVAISLAGGHLLGGPDHRDRANLAIASSIRHPGIAMMLASANFTDHRVSAAVLLFLLVGLLIGIPYKLWVKRSAPSPVAGQHTGAGS